MTRFHFLASTGRTATTWLADALNRIDGVLGCHEGYESGRADEAVLPLVNLENALCGHDREAARRTVAQKRNPQIVAAALERAGAAVLVDVAYYNATIAEALLELHPDCRGIGIIRDCASFVRSCTTLTGEDPLPVGWADPQKPLTPRETFIQMGRLRPRRGSAEHALWPQWSAISRNIWLWKTTNHLLLDAANRFPDRFLIMDFARFSADNDAFLAQVASYLAIGTPAPAASADSRQAVVNKKPFAYQVGPITDWSPLEQAQLRDAVAEIGARTAWPS